MHFDWTKFLPYFVMAGNVLGFYIKSRPDTGWFHNVLIPKWTFALGFLGGLLSTLHAFGNAAGLPVGAVNSSVQMAGFNFAALWPYIKAVVDALVCGGATMIGSHLTYEKGGVRELVPIVTPAVPKVARK